MNLSEKIENLIDSGNYEDAAKLFLKETGTTLEINFNFYGVYIYFADNQRRNVYDITLTKKGQIPYIFSFGDSIHNTENGGTPSNYDILSCLSVSYFESLDEIAEEFDCKPSVCIAIMEQEENLLELYNEDEIQALNTIS